MTRTLRLCVWLCLLFATAPRLRAQVATGLYSFGTFDNKGFDSIDVGNLNIHFAIPIRNKTGRAGMDFRYNLLYDSLIWAPVPVNGVTTWTLAPNYGWSVDTNVILGYILYNTITESCRNDTTGRNYTASENVNYRYVDVMGVRHLSPVTTGGCNPGDGADDADPADYTSDASHIYIDASHKTITMPSGTVIHPPFGQASGSGTVIDPNGNQISAASTGFTDTTGQAVLSISGSSTTSYTYSYKDLAGATQQAVLRYKAYHVQTAFGCSGITEYNSGSTNLYLVDTITLADNQSVYSFSYEPTPGVSGATTARLASVTLPTGGTTSYAYSGGCGNGLDPDGTTGAMTRATSDSAQPTQYVRAVINGNATQTVLTLPSGEATTYAFSIDSKTHRFLQTRQISNLYGLFTCYNSARADCTGAAISLPISFVQKVESFNGGRQTETHEYYSAAGNLTDVQDYDLDRVSLLRTTSYLYATTGTISNLLTQVIVSDGGGNTISNVLYNYDAGTPTGTSGLPQHTTATGTRGNLTSAVQIIVGGSGGTLTTSYTYDDTGSIRSATTPSGTTQYTYDATGSYPATVSLPTPSSGVALSSSATYDLNTGYVKTATDPNSSVTTLDTVDALLRPIHITNPDTGSQSIAYYSPTEYQTFQAITSSSNVQVYGQLDGYGRLHRSAIYNGQASNIWYQTDQCYDADGRLAFKSAPYQGPGFDTTTPVCSGNGDTYTYDMLGRITKITHTDGSYIQYSYWSRAVDVQGEAGGQRVLQYDALGRLSAVCEVSSNDKMPASGSPAPCGLDIAATGFLTTYTYSLAGHSVITNSGGPAREFWTDSLGRTTMTQEPEMFTGDSNTRTIYGYSYNSTGLVMTRTRPRANQTNSDVTTTTTTQYDSLGRVVSVSYNDGITPSKTYLYDKPGPWGEAGSQTNL